MSLLMVSVSPCQDLRMHRLTLVAPPSGNPFASPERFVDRLALLAEKIWSAFSDVEAVFEANAKLAVDHDCRLVAEAHTRLNRRLVAAHKVGPFVAVETDAVAGAMRQPGRFVIRTKARIDQDL